MANSIHCPPPQEDGESEESREGRLSSIMHFIEQLVGTKEDHGGKASIWVNQNRSKIAKKHGGVFI